LRADLNRRDEGGAARHIGHGVQIQGGFGALVVEGVSKRKIDLGPSAIVRAVGAEIIPGQRDVERIRIVGNDHGLIPVKVGAGWR